MGCCSLNPTACSRVVGEFPRKLGLLQDNHVLVELEPPETPKYPGRQA